MLPNKLFYMNRACRFNLIDLYYLGPNYCHNYKQFYVCSFFFQYSLRGMSGGPLPVVLWPLKP